MKKITDAPTSSQKDTTDGQRKPPAKYKTKTLTANRRVRSSQRLKGKMYKSKYKNTFERPLVCTNSDTEKREYNDVPAGKDVGDKAAASEDVMDVVTNTGNEATKCVNGCEFPWQTIYNDIDCGIFLMRHMETYNGTSVKGWRCGFPAERNIKGEVLGNQAKEIADLRTKYISKMLLSDVNTARFNVEKEVKDFACLDEDDRVKLEEKAVWRICQRLDGHP